MEKAYLSLKIAYGVLIESQETTFKKTTKKNKKKR